MTKEEKISEILENNGFSIKNDGEEIWVSQYTPAGEDWNLSFNKLEEIIDYADGFDPEEEFNCWIEAKMSGVSGVPDPSTLWQDQLWKQETLRRVANDVQDVL